MSVLRTALRAFLPAAAQDRLRAFRDRVQRAESTLRRYLPPAAGGPLSSRVRARVLGAGDAEAYLRLRRDPRQTASQLRQSLSSGEGLCVGLWLGSRLVAVGWCGPQRRMLGTEDWCFVSDHVDPRYRRRGLARALHRARLSALAERGVDHVYAFTSAKNVASQSALRAAGFVEVDDVRIRAALVASRRQAGAPDADPVLLRCATSDRGRVASP